jgi:carboxymethylenebutenolidase
MCDDRTERENKHWLAERLGRRKFNIGVGATAAVLVAGCDSSSDSDSANASTTMATQSSLVSIDTPDGTVDAFFVHPSTGRHPAIIMWPDILGVRDAFKMMATDLAETGYAVLVVNQYYRTAKAPVIGSWADWMTDEGRAKLQPMIAAITPAGTTSDAAAFVEWLDAQSAVDTKKKIGTCGYCMGGPFTFRTAASRPERVGAFASFHGANLVSDSPDSPHRLFETVEASALIAIAQNDDERQPDAKTVLKTSAEEAGVEAEVEVYPAQHGWCAIDSAVYDEAQAEKAKARMLAIFGEAL